MSNPGTEASDDRPRGRAPRGALAVAVLLPLVFAGLMAYALPRLGSGRVPAAGSIGAADFAAKPVAENRAAPAFDLPALEGTGSISRSPTGGIVVVNIWASWCPPCRAEAPHLERVWTEYRSRGVRFIGVDHKDTRGGGLSFVRQFGITYPVAFDPGGTVAARYGAVGVPTTFVIDRDGRIAYSFLGRATAAILTATLDKMLLSSR